MRILVIEDELRLAENVIAGLREAGFAVDHAAEGIEGLHCASQGIFDLVILDLMLPGLDGKSILSALRAKNVSTPVLILTAIEDKRTLIELFNSGADDFLAKPFDLGELIARVKALIRRSRGISSPKLRIAGLTIDTILQIVRREDQAIDLSPTEYRILECLAHRSRSITSKRELLEHLYDYSWERHSNVIEAHLSNLRRKLTVPGSISVIETLRGRGYRIRSEEDHG